MADFVDRSNEFNDFGGSSGAYIHSSVQVHDRGLAEPARKASQKQVGGSHYKDFPIQPLEFIYANDLGFCEGNAIKYICRHRVKGGRQDLEKAIHYLQLLIEITYDPNETNNNRIKDDQG